MRAYHVLDEIGYRNLAVLQGGLHQFREEILTDPYDGLNGGRYDQDVADFRLQAKQTIDQLIKDMKDKPQIVAKKPKKITGGC